MTQASCVEVQLHFISSVFVEPPSWLGVQQLDGVDDDSAASMRCCGVVGAIMAVPVDEI